MSDFKLDASLNDIIFTQDFTKELGKELKKLNYAQAFMWLGIKFLNEGVPKITSQELSKEVWGGKDESYCLKILKRFTQLRVLKSEKRAKHVRFFKLLADKEIFKEFTPIAMGKIKEEREARED